VRTSTNCDARHAGVLPLVAERLAAWPGVPPVVADAFRADAQGFAAADLLGEAELRRVIEALGRAGIESLVLKGAALAYLYYVRPDLRPRDDTDLLVAPAARVAAHDVLVALGYQRREHVAGAFVSYQAIYDISRAGLTHQTIDLHWRIANPQLFASVLEFEELRRSAVPIPAIGPEARGLAPAHALLLACVHRVAHHRDDDLLIWLYDIHLIASALTDAEWRESADLARRRQVLTICRHGLERARVHFGTVIAGSWDDEAAGRESSAEFLRRDRAQLATLLSDIRSLPSWSARGRLLYEHLVPPASYMRLTYAPTSRAPLPLLYAWRAIRGAWRWMARG
jgi:hypothetical protein